MDKYYEVNNGMLWEDAPDEKSYIWRYSGNPLFDIPNMEHFWHICNSATVMLNGEYIGLFRCEDKRGIPDLYLGKSKDGVHWDLETTPIVFYNQDGSVFKYPYAYDPRLIKVEDTYYTVFCADIEGPSIYVAKTKDFKRFEMLPNGFLPFNRNGVLFPEKINGQYVMLNRPSDAGDSPFGNIYISYSNDMEYWGHHKLLMKNFLNNCYWERVKIGAGPAPIKTDEGWLLIYHGVQKTCNGLTYSMGVALLDLEDPSKVLYRGNRYLLTPETTYERVGFTDNVCFPCAALVDSEGKITIYYGAADTNMAVAFTTVEKLLEFVKKYDNK
ncbi:MAG: glycoside hydrolase family 130 protein [Clostridia bacterium]|nr:glycoside hydrolase family 130 protein [Clostridia bacterium]